MLTAIIEANRNTLVVELPKGVADLRTKLLSIGILQPPDEIRLSDEPSDAIQVKLFAQEDKGRDLCLLLTAQDSLSTANMAAYLLEAASAPIRDTVTQRLRDDRYASVQDLITDIKTGARNETPVNLTLYFPITGYLDDGEEPAYEVSDDFVFRYRYEISDIIRDHQERGDGDIASYYRGNAGVKAKLLHAEWGVEEHHGNILLGKVKISLQEELTEKEKADLIDWVRGQNSDGAFECLDELPIETGYGGLAISLWNDSDDYFVCERAELDEYMSQHNSMKMGGM